MWFVILLMYAWLAPTSSPAAAPKVRPNPASRAVGGLVQTTAYLRYGGAQFRVVLTM